MCNVFIFLFSAIISFFFLPFSLSAFSELTVYNDVKLEGFLSQVPLELWVLSERFPNQIYT